MRAKRVDDGKKMLHDRFGFDENLSIVVPNHPNILTTEPGIAPGITLPSARLMMLAAVDLNNQAN